MWLITCTCNSAYSAHRRSNKMFDTACCSLAENVGGCRVTKRAEGCEAFFSNRMFLQRNVWRILRPPLRRCRLKLEFCFSFFFCVSNSIACAFFPCYGIPSFKGNMIIKSSTTKNSKKEKGPRKKRCGRVFFFFSSFCLAQVNDIFESLHSTVMLFRPFILGHILSNEALP